MNIEDDSKMLAAKINSETAIVSWKELEILFARGKVYVVDSTLDLVDVSLRITNDEKSYIQNKMNSGLIFQPELDWVKNNCEPETPFWASVVAPFVFIQAKQDA